MSDKDSLPDSEVSVQTSAKALFQNSFKDMMNDVVEAGSCCECGSCVLVCPHNVIDYINNKPKQVAKESNAFDFCGISEGVGCDVCASVCPRLWPREIHFRDAVFKDQRPYEDIFGVYRQIFVARTKREDLKDQVQDGGYRHRACSPGRRKRGKLMARLCLPSVQKMILVFLLPKLQQRLKK